MCEEEELDPWFIQIDGSNSVPVHRICVIRQTEANSCEIGLEGFEKMVTVFGNVRDIKAMIAKWLIARGIGPHDDS